MSRFILKYVSISLSLDFRDELASCTCSWRARFCCSRVGTGGGGGAGDVGVGTGGGCVWSASWRCCSRSARLFAP